jgi:hypothetical protein
MVIHYTTRHTINESIYVVRPLAEVVSGLCRGFFKKTHRPRGGGYMKK